MARPKGRPKSKNKPPANTSLGSDFASDVQAEWPEPYEGAINDWLRSGSRLTDLAISGGKGWPGGRVAELYGPEGTGKSLKGYLAGAQAQAQGGLFAVLQAERRKGEGLMVLCGVTDHPGCYKDFDPSNVEEATDQMEKLIEMKVSKNSPVPLVILVDSVSVLDGIQNTSLNEDMVHGKNKPMSAAACWTRFFKRDVVKEIAGKPIWIFLCNHVRDNVDFGGWGKKEDKVSGARVIKHMCSTRVRISEYMLDDADKKAEKERSTKDAKAPPMGKLLEFKIEKCGTGPPLRVSEMPWFFDHGAIECLGSWNWLYARKYINHVGQGRYSMLGVTYTKHDWIHHLLTDTGLYRAFDQYLVDCWMAHNTYPHPYGLGEEEETSEGEVPLLIL